MLAMVAIVMTGFPHFDAHRAFDFPPGAFAFNRGFVLGLGSATLIAVFNYLGYYDVCYIGDEVKNPAHVVPRSILYSLAILLCRISGLASRHHWSGAGGGKEYIRTSSFLILWSVFTAEARRSR